jgi:hypothetical protein
MYIVTRFSCSRWLSKILADQVFTHQRSWKSFCDISFLSLTIHGFFDILQLSLVISVLAAEKLSVTLNFAISLCLHFSVAVVVSLIWLLLFCSVAILIMNLIFDVIQSDNNVLYSPMRSLALHISQHHIDCASTTH